MNRIPTPPTGKTLPLDWATGDEDDFTPGEFAAQFNCTVELHEEVGPAGGWPTYVFTGKAGDIVNLVFAYAWIEFPDPINFQLADYLLGFVKS